MIAATRVECPTCGAAFGMECITASHSMCKSHAARTRAAEEAEFELFTAASVGAVDGVYSLSAARAARAARRVREYAIAGGPAK